MKNSENFKTVWWGILVIVIELYLNDRYPKLIEGSAWYFDIVIFIVWIGVCLAPISQEMDLFGVKFKQQIDDFKKDINHQLSVLKTELKSSIDVSSANSNQIYFQSSSIPPKDSETPDISEQIQRTLDKIGIKSAQEDDVYDYGVDPVHIEMYKIRLSLENLLRKYSDIDGKYQRRYSVSQLLNELRNYKQISKDILHGVTEVISVCNYAVHDEPLSNAQIAFVREFSPGLLKALKNELQNGL